MAACAARFPRIRRKQSMKNFVHRGEVLSLTAPYDVLSGAGFKVGNIFAVASGDAVSGAAVEGQVKGVVRIVKDASVFAQGDLVYWDDTAKKATSTVGSNLLIGNAEAAQLTGDATVDVVLFGVPGFSGQVNGVRVAHALYDYTVDGGASCTPANSDTIPANAVVFGGVVNSTAAVTASGSATVAIGTAAGSASNSILTATGKASLGLDAVVAPTCAATPFKMSAAGKISVTIATGPLTAGQIEVWVLYALASNA
jgi:predicted RecA/RadA family phage recombinase